MSEDIKYILKTSAEALFNVYRALVEYSKEKLDKKVYEILQKYRPIRIEIAMEGESYILKAKFSDESPIERIIFEVKEDVKIRYLTREQIRTLIELLEELSY